jgi:hypothetical protein
MPNTYVALRTETLATATSSVTFNLAGISGYTDLVLVCSARSTWTTDQYDGLGFTFNGDTGNNYSTTFVAGSGSSASSFRESNQPQISTRIDPSFSSNTAFSPIIVQIQNYSNTTTNKTVLIRSNANVEFYKVTASVGLWRNTAAITSIFIGNARGNLVAGSTFSLYGIANADQGAAKATGGIITEDSQYWYHTFGASGAFVPKQSLSCDVLVVAGGGGGGSNNRFCGGGGAGGLLLHSAQSLTAISYNVTVGAGGPVTTTGVNSQFASLTASAGGGAGSNGAGGNGGSGAGGGLTFVGGSASPSGQGNAGGSGVTTATRTAGGGGGAGAVGGNASNTYGGNGGVGVNTYSSWTIPTGTGANSGYFAGGGGGSAYNYNDGVIDAGIGGLGGGGKGGRYADTTGLTFSAIAGTPNTGGGGGGAAWPGAGSDGAAGGSGIVIVRYSK